MSMTRDNETVTVNDIELQEGDSLWRYAALNLYNKRVGDHDPDDVLRETAEALVENYPEEVSADSWGEKGHDPVEVVHANLRASPGIYDGTDLMRYHAMEVERISTSHGVTEISIKDWKEEQTHSFRDPEYDDVEDSSYTTFEPLSALEAHLGVTILPVDSDEETGERSG